LPKPLPASGRFAPGYDRCSEIASVIGVPATRQQIVYLRLNRFIAGDSAAAARLPQPEERYWKDR
jgi:hypothetical protein